MPIRLIIVSAMPRAEHERQRRQDERGAIQMPCRRSAPMPAGGRRGQPRGFGGVCSCLARPDQAGRPEDQDEHQQQVGNDRRDLRDGHVPQIRQRARPGRASRRTLRTGRRATTLTDDREGLDQADQQRGDERAGQRAEAADDDDDEQDRPEQARAMLGCVTQRRARRSRRRRPRARSRRRTPA